MEFFTAIKAAHLDAHYVDNFRVIKTLVGAKAENLEHMLLLIPSRIEELLQGFNDMRISGRGVHDNCLCSCIEICATTTYDSHVNKHYAIKFQTFNA